MAEISDSSFCGSQGIFISSRQSLYQTHIGVPPFPIIHAIKYVKIHMCLTHRNVEKHLFSWPKKHSLTVTSLPFSFLSVFFLLEFFFSSQTLVY